MSYIQIYILIEETLADGDWIQVDYRMNILIKTGEDMKLFLDINREISYSLWCSWGIY